MKKITSTILITLAAGFLNGQTVNLEWVKQMGGSTDEYGQSIFTDASGNVYTTGSFQNTVDFDPGPNVTNLTSSGADDIFISKLDVSGNLTWVKRIGNNFTDDGWGIAVDALGYVYTVGGFQGTVDFDPGAGTFNLTSLAQSSVFISKLDASGNFVWAKGMGSATFQNDGTVGKAIVLDGSANIYITGHFESTVAFGSFNLTASGPMPNIFVCKLDSSGTVSWAKGFLNSVAIQNNVNDGQGIALDASGNVYTTGPFDGSVDFDPDAGTATLPADGIFVSKLSPSGSFVWAKRFPSIDFFGISHIAVDASGNSFTAGNFAGMQVDFDPGPGSAKLTSSGSSDIFIAKLDASGNFGWVKKMGGQGFDVASSITLDVLGGIYTTGRFAFIADFNPGSGAFTLTSAGGDDIFISKLDASGIFAWAKQLGSTSDDNGNSIAVDGQYNVYTTGAFQGTADFDPGSGSVSLIAVGSYDAFVHKMSQLGVGISENNFENNIQLFPNPTTGEFTIAAGSLFNKAEVEIVNLMGQVVLQKSFANVSTLSLQMEIPPGMYFVTIKNNKGEKAVLKVVKE